MIDPALKETRPAADDRMLRQFAGLWLALFGTLAVVEFVLRHRSGRALVWAIVAAAVGPVGLLRPGRIRPVFTGAMAVATPIGLVTSRILLGVLFYLVFAPIALVFRVMGRDALQRRRQPGLPTFWTAKEQPPDLQSYLRQS
jgi:saxitoxin biosynthesis operon SxtJ-like protein